MITHTKRPFKIQISWLEDDIHYNTCLSFRSIEAACEYYDTFDRTRYPGNIFVTKLFIEKNNIPIVGTMPAASGGMKYLDNNGNVQQLSADKLINDVYPATGQAKLFIQ